MNQRFRYGQFPAGNPLANALVVIVGIVVISLSLALGFFVFLGIAGFFIVMAGVMTVRNWWYRRGLGRTNAPGSTSYEKPSDPLVIEGEFKQVGDSRGPDKPS